MIGISRSVLLALATLATAIATTVVAEAESLTFHMRSTYPYAVSVEFYAQGRSHVWPGKGRSMSSVTMTITPTR